MAGKDFLKFNNGQKFSFSNFREIKEDDLMNADAATKRLFNIFAGDDMLLQASEAQSLWQKIKTAATLNRQEDSLVFDNDEMQIFLNDDKDIKSLSNNFKFNINSLKNIISITFNSTASERTRKKYDTATIKKEASELTKKIHDQISGASLNENTINMLRAITPENAAFVISEYQRMYGVSLAKDIDDEWGLDIATVKEHVCKKLVDQAKSLGIKGIYYGDYQKINDLKSLQTWINNASSKIINTMSNATETYYATEAEETQRQQSAENAKTAKASAEQIVNDLIKHTSGWNDVDKIKAAIARIDNPEELKQVNRLLTIKGYPPTDKYSPIENFIYKEANHNVAHTYNSSDYLEQVVQDWIDNDTLKGQAANEAQARMAARVLYDGGDGFGTDPEKIKKAIRMIKCPKPTGNREADNKQAREVYRLVNEMIKKHNTFYGLGSPCTDLLDYCKGEMWDSEVKYLNGILAETNAIQGEEKAQAIKDLTQEAVEGAGTDIEYLEHAIKAIDSPEDRKAVEAKLAEYCKKKGIKPQIQGQAYLQAILYDECDTFMGISRDHKEIRKFNEMLIEQGAYTEEEIVNLRAEQAALQILAGDFDNIKDAVEQIKDPKVLAKVKVLLKSKGYNSLDEFLSKKLNQTKSDLINAELASNNVLLDANGNIDVNKIADVAYRLMQNSDFDVRAMGVKAIRNEQVAKAVDAKFKQNGGSLAKFMEQFNKEKAEYKSKAEFWDGWGKLLLGGLAEDISDAYKENTDKSDNLYVEMQSAQSLTPQQQASYGMTVKLMEQKLAQMKKDYQAALDSQGAVSWAVNKFCEQYGLGTTREEIQARIEHDTETVRLLKLAAEGKLGKMVNGETVAVTFEEVFKERNVGTNFDTAKVAKVHNQAEMLVAMNYAKTNIAVCWEELENGLSSSDSKRLSVAIIDTLEKLSQMTGQQLSLAGYGYTVKDGIILDSNGKSVSVDKLKELANQLKQGLSDVAKDLLGQDIPLNTSSSKINEVLEDAFNSKKESFKQEFKDAFGQDCPDEMVENYISTIETGKMVVNMGVLIGAVIAAPFTGGGSLAVFAAGAGASLGLNALEHSTDANGYTNSEWTGDVSQAMWDGALTAIGMKVGQYAEVFAKGGQATRSMNKVLQKLYGTNAEQVLVKANQIANQLESFTGKVGRQALSTNKATIMSRFPKIDPAKAEKVAVLFTRAEAVGIEITSDAMQSLVQTYCMEGEFNEKSFMMAMIMSVAGNSLGHTIGTVNDVRGSGILFNELTHQLEIDDIVSSNTNYARYLDDLCTKQPHLRQVRQQLEDINNSFGVKIILPENLTQTTSIREIYSELSSFKRQASNAGARVNLPEYIDFTNPALAIRNLDAIFDEVNNSVSMQDLSVEDIKRNLRHELVHANDTKIGVTDFPKDFDMHKYANELLDNGIDANHVVYAFTDKNEFLAVAAEGNMRNYSPELRQTLVDLGMPRWMLDMENSVPTRKKPTATNRAAMHEAIDAQRAGGNQPRVHGQEETPVHENGQINHILEPEQGIPYVGQHHANLREAFGEKFECFKIDNNGQEYLVCRDGTSFKLNNVSQGGSSITLTCMDDITLPNGIVLKLKGLDIDYDIKNKLLNLSKLDQTSWETIFPEYKNEIQRLVSQLPENHPYRQFVETRLRNAENLTQDVYSQYFVEFQDIIDKLTLQDKGWLKTSLISDAQIIINGKEIAVPLPTHLKDKNITFVETIKTEHNEFYINYYNDKGDFIGRGILGSDGSLKRYTVYESSFTGKVYDCNDQTIKEFSPTDGGTDKDGNNIHKGAKIDSAARTQRYAHIKLSSSNSSICDIRTNVFNNLNNGSERIYADFRAELTNLVNQEPKLTVKGMSRELAKILDQNEFKTILNNIGDNIVLNFGVGKDGKLYIGLNSISDIAGIDIEKLAIRHNMNVFEGNCSETSLKAISGNALEDCVVYDLGIRRNSQGQWKVSEYPPCPTCSSNVALWGWIYPRKN